LVDEGEGILASAFRKFVPLAIGSPGTGETSTVRICTDAMFPKVKQAARAGESRHARPLCRSGQGENRKESSITSEKSGKRLLLLYATFAVKNYPPKLVLL